MPGAAADVQQPVAEPPFAEFAFFAFYFFHQRIDQIKFLPQCVVAHQPIDLVDESLAGVAVRNVGIRLVVVVRLGFVRTRAGEFEAAAFATDNLEFLLANGVVFANQEVFRQ